MKLKLHFGLLILLLAFLGTYLEQTTLPNQQIVIEFLDKDIAKEDAETAVETIKEQLQRIGAKLIRIDRNDDGQLKITYYSESNVEQIQSLLITEQDFKFAYDSDHKTPINFPKNKRLKDYELNISEIQNTNKINWDFERTEIVRLNQKSDSSYTPSVKFLGCNLRELYNINTVKVAVQINKAIVIAIDEGSYNIPEGRAGPRSIGII